MKFKIDENLPAAFAAELRTAGHEADTVRDEKLEGATDDVVLATCDHEGRVLVTEDLDFANVVAYPPTATWASSSPAHGSRGSARCRRRLVLPNLSASLVGQLWIVEDDRVRIHGAAPGP